MCNPLASDSDDESKLNRIESRAVRKKKNQQKSKSKARAAAAYGYSDSLYQRMWGAIGTEAGAFSHPFQPHPMAARFGSFRVYPVQGVDQRGIFPIGLCFACGESNHIPRTCPYIKSASTPQQPELPAKKLGSSIRGIPGF